MARLEIILVTDYPEEAAAYEAWLEKWRDQVSSVSGNSGCGCCVDIFEVEATPEAIADFERQFAAIYQARLANSP